MQNAQGIISNGFSLDSARAAETARLSVQPQTWPLGRRPIFLLLDSHHDPERLFRQRPLQRLRFIRGRAHSDVGLFIGGRDHRHGFLMDWREHHVGHSRQEAVEEAGPEVAVATTLGYPALMPAFICTACGTQYAPSEAPPGRV